jgi:mono/diheme cytochrome c family protein
MSFVRMVSSRPFPCFAALAVLIVAGGLVAIVATAERRRVEVARILTQGNPEAAPQIMRRYGCAGCHTIPGVPGADGQVGGSLDGLRQRVYIAGIANNTADNLTRWIVSPQSFSPNSAMPATGISEAEARDVAAYLYGH